MPITRLVPPSEWPTLGWQVIDWCEKYLCHGPGDIQGEPLFFDDEWAQIVLDMYRLYPKGHRRAGRRVVAYGVASLPKGRAKSEIAGALACVELLGPVRFGGWDPEALGGCVGRRVVYPFIRCLATEEGQTGNTYRNVMVMLGHAVEKFPDEFPGLDIGLTRVYLGPGGVNGEIRPSTSGSASKDGGKETFAVADETHRYDKPELIEMHDLVRQNCGKRKDSEPWMLATTTMFEPGAGSVAEVQYGEAERLIELDQAGKRVTFGFCMHHRQGTITADSWEDDEAQLESLTEAYGSAAEWMDLENILENDIRAPGKKISEAARHWHNLEWKGEHKAVDLAKWDALADPSRNPTGGELVVVGFDGSDRGEHADDTVLVGCVVGAVPHLFFVEAWRRPPRAGRDYKVPRHLVRKKVTALADMVTLRRMACDPPGWREEIDSWDLELGNWNDDPEDPVVVEFLTARPTVMGPAIDRFLEMLDEAKFTHDGSAELRYYVGNALLGKAKGQGNYPALDKPTVDEKIDGLVAAVIALAEAVEVPDVEVDLVSQIL